jgi:NAD(P)H-hydrate epimerase
MVDHLIESSAAPLEERIDVRIAAMLEGKKAVALGPGLSTETGASALTARVLKALQVPAVVYADAIKILAANPALLKNDIEAPLVLTPHPGEMGRLVKKSAKEVQADRIGISREYAERHGVVLVLKGAGTVIAAPDGRLFVNPTGNPGMASGGMGDVLTGVIGGFLAQGLDPLEAALLGVYLHGLAGDCAAKQVGMSSLVASDVISELSTILRDG